MMKLRAGRSPLYLLGMLGSARAVCLRAGWDPAQSVEWQDVRDILKRSPQRPLRQATPARRADVRRLLQAVSRSHLALLCVVLWSTAARFSDWSRPGLLGCGPTPADVHLRSIAGTVQIWEVRYRVTKTDPTGLTRRLTFRLPTAASRAFARLHRSTPREAPLFNVQPSQLRTWLYALYVRGTLSRRLTLHSFRRGAVQAALLHMVPGQAVMRVTGHSTLALLARYADTVPPEWRRHQLLMSRALW